MNSKTYGPNHLETQPVAQLGEPGAFPFTRGIYPTMYQKRLWTMRQYAGFGTAEESNQRYQYLLKQGVSGLSVAFDLPTQIGYDSDDPLAAGEVGRVGVAIDSIDDMTQLFDKIPLDRVSTSMTINATAIILLALYIATAKRQGVEIGSLAGTLQNDILKEYVARGTYIYPPAPSLRIVTDVVEDCEQKLPRWHPISISGYHIREAGATAPQEVAFTFAHAIAYVEAAEKSEHLCQRAIDLERLGERSEQQRVGVAKERVRGPVDQRGVPIWARRRRATGTARRPTAAQSTARTATPWRAGPSQRHRRPAVPAPTPALPAAPAASQRGAVQR